MEFKKYITTVVVLCSFMTVSINAMQAGDLDPSFDEDGRVTTAFEDDAFGFALTLQNDCKIVLAGQTDDGEVLSIALARYNPDGSLDTTFAGGTVVSDLAEAAFGVVSRPNRQLVTAGMFEGDFALVQFNENGSVDTTGFGTIGTGGVTLTDFGGIDQANAIVLYPDGRVAAAGFTTAGPEGSGDNFALARYNINGTLDTGFNGTGQVITDFFGLDDQARALILQPDGKLVAAGFATQEGGDIDFGLARYNVDGTLDTTGFGTTGTGGLVTTDFGLNNVDEAFALVLQPDGKLVAGGFTTDAGGNRLFALARYNSNGTLDLMFGTNGLVTLTFADLLPGGLFEIRGLALQADGKIVAVGIDSSTNNFFLVARFNADGSLDTTFGDNGRVITPFEDAVNAFSRAVVIQPNGRIVVGGHVFDQDEQQDVFALARYFANEITASSSILIDAIREKYCPLC